MPTLQQQESTNSFVTTKFFWDEKLKREWEKSGDVSAHMYKVPLTPKSTKKWRKKRKVFWVVVMSFQEKLLHACMPSSLLLMIQRCMKLFFWIDMNENSRLQPTLARNMFYMSTHTTVAVVASKQQQQQAAWKVGLLTHMVIFPRSDEINSKKKYNAPTWE